MLGLITNYFNFIHKILIQSKKIFISDLTLHNNCQTAILGIISLIK